MTHPRRCVELPKVADNTGCRRQPAPLDAGAWPTSGIPTFGVNIPRLSSRASEKSGIGSWDGPLELEGTSAEGVSNVELRVEITDKVRVYAIVIVRHRESASNTYQLTSLCLGRGETDAAFVGAVLRKCAPRGLMARVRR